ncbi:DUF4097 family beta strand repeat-containing protein [Fodinibius sp. Rm-B-1B1-1]|uniref:DUF4097 family beta strand repeat-containing protein n=1 Tax=Fodinibius alkaliphilus TaxID=3140241 RepID=UPI00315A8B8C
MTTRKLYLAKVFLAFTISLIMTLLLMRSALAITSSPSADQDNPYRVEEFDINTPGNLEVRTSGGHITVEASTSNSVRVEMYVRKDGENLRPQDYDLDQWDIDISKSGNSIKANAKHKGNNGWSGWNNDRVSISFVVHTPRQMSSDLKTSGGHVEVDGLEGNQEITTSGGHLNLANLKGSIEAKTSGGHIELLNLEGEINAKTSGGHISAKTVAGTLDAETSGGHINLTDVSGSVEASTSGGSITADLTTIDQFVDLKTSGGNVDISIPDNISVDLQLRGTFVQGKLKNFSGEMEKNKVNGQLNGGGPKISARTSGGTVRLSFN